MSKSKKHTPDPEISENTRTFKMAVIRRVARYLLMHKGTVIFCFLLMITANVLALAAPKLSQRAIDAIEPGVEAVDFESILYLNLPHI